jgi:hypothetical protein
MVDGKWKMENPQPSAAFSIYHLPFSIQAGIFQRPANVGIHIALRGAHCLLCGTAAHRQASRAVARGDAVARARDSGGRALVASVALYAPAFDSRVPVASNRLDELRRHGSSMKSTPCG